MDLGIANKVAIVTGAGQGIGKAIAKTFALEGVKVSIADLNEDKGQAVVEEILAEGGEALMKKTDVSDIAAVGELINSTMERFGGVDIVVNDAAAPRTFADFWEVDPTIWHQNVEVNLYGSMNTARMVIEHMIEKKFGRIINVASDSGRVGELKCAWYAASKAGVIGFTKGLAKDVGRYGVTVNNICPGFTMVERYEEQNVRLREKLGSEKFEERQKRLLSQYPMRKLGTPQDVADMVVFIASARAGHITGQTISVNGGYSML